MAANRMGIFGLDDVYSGGGLFGIATPAPQRTPQAGGSASWYSPRQHTATGYLNLRKDPQTMWDRLFNDAYMQAHDQKIHLGNNIFEAFKPGDYLPKPEKRTRQVGFDWHTGQPKTEEYWHTHDLDVEQWRDTIYNAIRQGEQDGREFRERNKLEVDTWTQQDREKKDADDLARRQREVAAAMERRAQESQEQAKYQAAVNAAQSARQQMAASQSVKKFAADPAAAYGAGGGGAASQKMVSHKGLDNDPKLGRAEKLGQKRLLGE